MCLTWFLLTNGLLPHVARVTCYNNIFIPFTKLINKFCEFLGNTIVSIGSNLIQFESFVFNQFNYINPIYNGLKLVENMFDNININTYPPSYHYFPSNIRQRKTSTGRHLCSYFARKRHLRRQQVIISGSLTEKNDNNGTSKSDTKPSFPPREPCVFDFHPMDNPSCQDNTWYDAISPYWTGGMIWDGAYVLNHQVVSVTTDPIFVLNLPLVLELSATIQAPEARSEGENVGPQASIALDSGSSIHIFKDAFLLTALRL
jgi:hypothetical protein